VPDLEHKYICAIFVISKSTKKNRARATLKPVLIVSAKGTKNMTQAENIKKWLEARRGLLNLKGIEESAGIPTSTLKNFLRGERGLPEHHEVVISKLLATIGYEPVTE
jgi:hypothetical protein